MDLHYFVSMFGKEQEVTVEQFILIERICGFSGPGHFKHPMEPATHSFDQGPISGRTIYIPTLSDVT